MALRIRRARSADFSGGWGPAWQPSPMVTIGALAADPRSAKVPSQIAEFDDVFLGFRGIADPLGRVALESRKFASRRARSRQVSEQNFLGLPVRVFVERGIAGRAAAASALTN